MRRVATVALGAMLALAIVPDVAGAATVRVVEETVSTTPPEERATLIFEAAAGEQNTVSVARVGEEQGKARYDVHDLTNEVVAGPGCRDGGPPGVAAICLVPFSRPATCGHLGCTDRGREITLSFLLGDGNDELRAAQIPADDGGHGSVIVAADGGEGVDRLETGATTDQLDPGPGADTVVSEAGDDAVDAGDSPDGPDVIDLGAGFDEVSYLRASVPLEISLDGRPNDGAADERDVVLAAERVIGGSASDRLTGSGVKEHGPNGVAEELYGGGGGDFLIGKGGSDLLFAPPPPGLVRPSSLRASGHDVLRGGAGNDQITAGDGADLATGGRGDDALTLGIGNDRGRGGIGKDFLGGDAGADRLEGGAGRDDIDAGATDVDRGDDAVDRIDCGASPRDHARDVERSDVVRNCENVISGFVPPPDRRPPR